jgi:hypothetical protein
MITVRPLEAGVYAVSPYPFKEDRAEFAFSGRYVKPAPKGSDGDFSAALRATPTHWQRFTLVNRH